MVLDVAAEVTKQVAKGTRQWALFNQSIHQGKSVLPSCFTDTCRFSFPYTVQYQFKVGVDHLTQKNRN